MAQGQSIKSFSMIEWILTSRLSIKNALLVVSARRVVPASNGLIQVRILKVE